MTEQQEAEVAATALDVAHGITGLIAACLDATSSLSEDRRYIDLTLADHSGVMEAEQSLAVALESWLAEAGVFISSEVVQGLSEPLLARLGSMHDDLHTPPL